MKTNILVTGVVLTTVGAVLLYPTIRGNAAVTPPPRNIVAPIATAATRMSPKSSI